MEGLPQKIISVSNAVIDSASVPDSALHSHSFLDNVPDIQSVLQINLVFTHL